MSATGNMMPLHDAAAFAVDNNLLLVSIADVVVTGARARSWSSKWAWLGYRPSTATSCHACRSVLDGVDHIAFVMGDVDGGDPPLVRVHSECLTGDILGSSVVTVDPSSIWPSRRSPTRAGRSDLPPGSRGRHRHRSQDACLCPAGSGTRYGRGQRPQGLPVDSQEYGVETRTCSPISV